MLVALAGVTHADSNPATPVHVRMVVGSVDVPHEGDVLLRDHLRTGLNLHVSWIDEDTRAGDAADADTVGLYLISESVTSSAVGERYRDLPVPVLVLENALWDDMGMARDHDTVFGGAPIVVDRPELLGRLAPPAGRHDLTEGGADLKYAIGVAPGAEVASRTADDSGHPVAFRIAKGAELHGGSAAADRIGLGIVVEAVPRLAAGGWDQIDAAVSSLLGDSPPPRAASALLLAGHTESDLLPAEFALRARLRALGFDVSVVKDDAIDEHSLEGTDIVIMSKTVESVRVGGALRDVSVPILFWEDNQQALSMLATTSSDLDGPTDWHDRGATVVVGPALAAGFGGRSRVPVGFYERQDELTYAPPTTLASGAVPIATFGDDPDDERVVVYVVPRGAILADGRTAAHHRAFFGLYDETFDLLTLDGVALFDAVTLWLTSDRESLPAEDAP